MNLKDILEEYGLSQKETTVYLALLELGPSPARAVARKSGVNRGTAYDILKKLVDLGLTSFYRKGKQHFAPEPPERLIEAVEDKQTKLQKLKVNITDKLPELKTMFAQQGGRPSIRVYEGSKGIKKILEDILNTVGELKEKEYFVYSTATEKDRQVIYKDFPTFNEKRIDKDIKVRTISLGAGGSPAGLDERKWLKSTSDKTLATHEIMYASKVAHIGLDHTNNPFGVIIENPGIFESQRQVFETLWKRL